MPIDILQSGFMPGHTIYILAPGPKGKPYWSEIPDNAFVIAVNQAIEIPNVNKSIWLCADKTLPEKKWFKKNLIELLEACNPLNDVILPTPVILDALIQLILNEGVLLDSYPETSYFFKQGRTLAKSTSECETGVLRGGATISSQAVQLAFLLKVKHIILCGVDMEGHYYYDGTKTDNVQMPRGEEKWLARQWFKALIIWIRKQGIEITSLSPTALELLK